LKESLQKRDEELAQAVMEQIDPHPMIKKGEWITLTPIGWGTAIMNNVSNNFKETKKRVVAEWRKKPHFKLVGCNDAKPWVVPAASAKRPLDMSNISVQEQERSKRLKAIAKRVGYVPGELLG
jgi:type II secretory pathway component PulC